MRRLIRDPRIRFLVLLVVVLLGLALAWHLAGEHAAALGACVAVLGALMVWALPGPSVRPLVPADAQVTTPIPASRIPSPGRHPPDEGTVLRL